MATALRITFQPYDSTPETIVTIEATTASFDAEQTLNIGHSETDVGAGMVTFHPFTFTKQPDIHSADLWLRMCRGNAFQKVTVTVAKGGDESKDAKGKPGEQNKAGEPGKADEKKDKTDDKNKSGEAEKPFLTFIMGLVAVKNFAFSLNADGAPTETVTLEYGQAAYSVTPKYPDGSFGQPVGAGWNRVTNQQITPSSVGS
jgi:type VI protein secretion system component Hcp